MKLTNIEGKCIGKWIGVQYDVTHNKIFDVGGVQLIRADEWLNKSEEGKTTYAENTNYLDSKPQICTVIMANDAYPYKVGDKLFCHYMAHECSQCGDIVTHEAFIIADYVFFTILPDGTWKMADSIYAGEQVYTGEVVRPSGIITDMGGKKENLRVKITHIPDDADDVQIGDTVVSIDKYNYEFTIHPNKYIKLTAQEIAGKINATQIA